MRFLGQDRALGWQVAVAAVSCTLLWVYGTQLVGDFRVDDAYITFTYSKNLADGLGPIYSVGQKVEGYSNFLWMVLIACGELFGAEPLGFARGLSHLFFGLILGSTFLLTRKTAGGLAAVIAVVWLATSSDFYRAIQSGLESVAYAGFIAAGLCHYFLEQPDNRRWSLLWFAGAALTRIDGVVPLGLIGALEGLRALYVGRVPWKALVRWAAIGVAPVALYWVWRTSYYGLLFPLPYYAKASLGIVDEYRGADYVWSWIRESGLWVAALGATAGLLASRRAPLAVIGVFIVMLVGYVVHVGGDWMPFNRMLLPVLAPLIALSCVALGALAPALSALRDVRRALALLAGLGLVALSAMHLTQATVETKIEEQKLGFAKHIKDHTAGLLKTAPFVQALVRAPGDVLVTDYGGIFAYGSRASVIEMWGLCNRDIAMRGNTDGITPIYGKTCVPCYADFNPDYFHSITPLLREPKAIRSKQQLIGQIFQGRAIDSVIGLAKNYLVGRVRRPSSEETLWFLERKREGVSFEPRKVDGFLIDYPNIR